LANEEYDAIVVGSGISGGWAAKELTEKGLRVLMLERGKNIEHIVDYVNATKGPWEYPFRAGRSYAMEEAYPVLRRDYPLNEKNLDWWASDKDSPYTEIKRFDWFRGYHVGGRSLLWGRQSYRHGDLDFEANAREGIAIDWPIRYADIAPSTTQMSFAYSNAIWLALIVGFRNSRVGPSAKARETVVPAAEAAAGAASCCRAAAVDAIRSGATSALAMAKRVEAMVLPAVEV
jgi:choline dehydrogenase-like flavoprotein